MSRPTDRPERQADKPAAPSTETPRSCLARWTTAGGMRQCGCLLDAGHEGEHVCVCGPQSGTCVEPSPPPVPAPDKCEFCLGAKGGVLGNENVLGGIVVCDYCSVLVWEIQKAEPPVPAPAGERKCPTCGAQPGEPCEQRRTTGPLRGRNVTHAARRAGAVPAVEAGEGHVHEVFRDGVEEGEITCSRPECRLPVTAPPPPASGPEAPEETVEEMSQRLLAGAAAIGNEILRERRETEPLSPSLAHEIYDAIRARFVSYSRHWPDEIAARDRLWWNWLAAYLRDKLRSAGSRESGPEADPEAPRLPPSPAEWDALRSREKALEEALGRAQAREERHSQEWAALQARCGEMEEALKGRDALLDRIIQQMERWKAAALERRGE